MADENKEEQSQPQHYTDDALEDIPWDDEQIISQEENNIVNPPEHPDFNRYNYVHYMAAGAPVDIKGTQILVCATHKGKRSDRMCSEWPNWHTHYLLAVPLDQGPGEHFGRQEPADITIHRRWRATWCEQMQKHCCERNRVKKTIQDCKTCQSKNNLKRVETDTHFENLIPYMQKRYEEGLNQWKLSQPELARLHPKDRRTRFNISVRKHFNEVQQQEEIQCTDN